MFARTHRVFSHVPFGRLKNPKRPARRHAEGGRLTYFLWSDIHELGSVCSTKPYQNHGGSRPYLRITSKKFRRDLYPCSLQARNLTKITGVRGRTFSQTHNIAVATSFRESLVICGWSVIPVKKSRSQEFILIISTKNNILTFVL
mgnify:CR=1 FL=1